MSLESAKQFIERMKTDEEFFTRVTGCKDVAERTQLVRSEGFDFSSEEINRLKDELTDDESNRVLSEESRLGFDGAAGHGWVKSPEPSLE